MKSKQFRIQINPHNGSVESICHPADEHGMNWVVSNPDNPWHVSANNWGLGYVYFSKDAVDKIPYQRWEIPASLKLGSSSCSATYMLGPLEITCKRKVTVSGLFRETYAFTNTGNEDIRLHALGIYTPFNDNYPDSQTCVRRRCNAHLWCGGDVAYVNCLRMGGTAPHLGLVVRQGSFSGYAIESRGIVGTSSNARGDIVLLSDIKSIPAGKTETISWDLFWHDGWDAFEKKVIASSPVGLVRANRYCLTTGDPVELELDTNKKHGELAIACNGKPVKFKTEAGRFVIAPVQKTGEYRYEVVADGRKGIANLLVTDPPPSLIRKRIDFIIEKQQETDPESALFGAFLIYDNETRTRICGTGDYNEGRERVAMGVLLAQYLQKSNDRTVHRALMKYYDFVRHKLQNKAGDVYNSTTDHRYRGYNYPWVAQFYLELFKATAEAKYLDDMYCTLRAFYRKGHRFYAIGIPVRNSIEALDQAGMHRQKNHLLRQYRKQAEFIIEHDIAYPPHEVNYEQTIVGPATGFLLEMFLVTGEERFLHVAKPHLACLEAFNGRQPDFHLHEIAIRHWDGWWFGKRPLWGDTFPHYWSTVTAIVFWRYWQATGEINYLERAQTIVLNNLCLFKPDGQAACAYLYPDLVNGHPGKYYDPYANDQDWALVHYNMIEDDLRKIEP